MSKKKKIQPLDHQIVNVETPDRGIGPGTMTLLLSHPVKGEEEVAKDVKADWDKSVAQAKKKAVDWSHNDALLLMADKGWKHEPIDTVTLEY